MLNGGEERERDAIKTFVQGAVSGDLRLFASSIGLVEEACAWCRAFRAVAKQAAPLGAPARLRTRFARVWVADGDHLRSEVGNDLVLIAGLRVLLPPYVGGPMRLYRGDSAWNRRRRTYGVSWTAEIDVARGFAKGWRTFEGGSVLLTTMAAPDAIISVPTAAHDSRFKEEKEYLVDRRRLLQVAVVERYQQKILRTGKRAAS